MSTYGWILLLSLSIPFIFSFHPLIKFHHKLTQALLAAVIVAIPFLIWDAASVANQSWGFNHNHVGNLFIAGMPIEEILFFIVIPYCCLFIWAVLDKYKADKKIKLSVRFWQGLTAVFLIAAVIFRNNFYSFLMMLWSAGTILIMLKLDKKLLNSSNYWLWIALTFIPFLIVNGLLTGIPIVWYGQAAIWNIRITSIPLEDFFYSWSLLTLNLVVFKKLSYAIHSINNQTKPSKSGP